jgi:hypothetical protein
MKTKALKKILIEKSDEISIKDLSQSIILRAQKEVILTPTKQKSSLIFRYKPALAFVFLMLLTFSFFIFTPKQYSFAYQINQNEEDIILTSISTLQIGTSDIIQLTSLDDEPMINAQIPNMKDYLLWMELLFNQEEVKFIQKDQISENAIKHYTFSSKALDDQSILYEFVIINQKRSFGMLEINGLITHDEDSFPFIILISTRNQQTFEMRVNITDEIVIITQFQKQIHQRDYSIKIYENEILVSEMTLNRFKENQEPILDLTIQKGTIDGSYRFRRDNGALTITYSIANLIKSESGTMRVEIKNDTEDKTFQIQINPQGRPSFIIETPRPPVRPNPPARPNPPFGKGN